MVLTKKSHVERIGRAIELVGVQDTTLSGSRSAFAPLMLWYAFAKYGDAGFRKLVADMLDTAEYAVERFNARGHSGLAAQELGDRGLSPAGPPKYSASGQMAPEGEVTHIITMPHVTRQMVDELVADCAG